jgi:type II secretory pathway component PulM
MAESALAQLAGTGVVGLVLVLALLALWQKDKDYKAESKARIDDAQRMLAILMQMQKDVTTAVAALTEIVEKWEKREEERERHAREASPAGRR